MALYASGTAARVHDPNTGQVVATITPVSSGVPWAGVAGFDVDPNHAGDELFFTRRLDQTSGLGGGFEVYTNQSGSNRLGYSLGDQHYRAVTEALVLDGGTRAGLVTHRADLSSGGSPIFEVWDPSQIVTDNTSAGNYPGRIEFHVGPNDRQWDRNILVAAEFSSSAATLVNSSTPGDEIVVLISDADTSVYERTLVKVYGRTGGTGDATYNDISYGRLDDRIETFTIAQGILPGGEDAVVFLREDGRITFWGFDFFDRDPTGTNGTRYAYTAVDDGFENFVRVADVLDSHAGQELIVGYNDTATGERGYRLYGLPSEWMNNEETLALLGSYDLGAEIRNIDLITIPEPASISLLIGSGLLLGLRRRRSV